MMMMTTSSATSFVVKIMNEQESSDIIPTNVKEAHLALDRDRNSRRQSLDEQIRLKNENIEKEILLTRQGDGEEEGTGTGGTGVGGIGGETGVRRGSGSGGVGGGLGSNEDDGRLSVSEKRKLFHNTLPGASEIILKQILQRNMDPLSRSQNTHLTSDLEAILLFTQQEKIDFMQYWYDQQREEGGGSGDRSGDGNIGELPEQFLSSLGISKEKCLDQDWRQWVIALSKSAAYDRSSRRRSSSTAPIFPPSLSPSTSTSSSSSPSPHYPPPPPSQENGEVIVPTRRESVADIRRKFSSRSKLDTTETEFHRIIKRYLQVPSSHRHENSSYLHDCSVVKSITSTEKIEFISTWYDLVRESREGGGGGGPGSGPGGGGGAGGQEDSHFHSNETPEEFLFSFEITKETCSESEWHEWVIALSKSAAYDRSSQQRRSSSSRKLNSPNERNSLTNGEEEGRGEGRRPSETINTTTNTTANININQTNENENEKNVAPAPPSQSSPPSQSNEEPTRSNSTTTTTPTNTRSYSSSSSQIDNFHSQVISPSSSSSSSSISLSSVEYKKSLSAASVVFAQAPDEDRESMWSNVELSFSDVAKTTSQNPYSVSSPLHPTSSSSASCSSPPSNCQHISIDNTENQHSKSSSCCCILS